MAKKDDAVTDIAQDVVASAPTARQPDHHLVVRHPFGNYAKGAMITDADEIDAILAGDGKDSVHKIAPQK